MDQTDNNKIKISSTSSQSYTGNVLPCRIKFSGVVTTHFAPDQGYWSVEREGDAVTTYFRGRKLNGKAVSLPERGFQGFIIGKDQESGGYNTVGTFSDLNTFHNGNNAQDNSLELIEEWLQVSSALNS